MTSRPSQTVCEHTKGLASFPGDKAELHSHVESRWPPLVNTSFRTDKLKLDSLLIA